DDAHVPGDRLDDDRGQALAVALDGGSGGVDVVEGADDGVARGACGDPGAGGHPEGGAAGPARDKERVRMPVVAPGELDDTVPVREPPREADGAHGGFRPGGDEAHLLDGG